MNESKAAIGAAQDQSCAGEVVWSRHVGKNAAQQFLGPFLWPKNPYVMTVMPPLFRISTLKDNK